MKRLGMFIFYDKQGIAGKYVEYLVKEIKENVNDLFIISNCALTNSSKEIFLKYTNNVIERENCGFDGGAYQDVLCNVIGLDNCKKWDELLLINDTFYGPFCPLSTIFKKMENVRCDFWGLSVHGDNKENTQRIIFRHIQSYFLVIRSNLLRSTYFSEFWLNMKEIKSYRTAVDNFEIAFTQFFSKYGFLYEAFVDTTSFELGYEEKAINCVGLMPYELLVNKGFPIVKRKSIVSRNAFQTEALKILQYINNNTDYDVQMIWQDLLRKYNIYELIFEMNLFYIVDSKINLDLSVDFSEQVVVVIRIDTLKSLEDIIPCIDKIDKIIAVYIWTEKFDLLSSIKEKCKNIKLCYCKNQQENYKFWKRMSEEFDFIGYVYIKTAFKDNYISNYLMLNNIQENLIKNEQYIYNICNLMMEEKALGLLLPPLSKYRNYEYIWGEDAFWIKGICLSTLCEYREMQWLPEQVQKLGFYSAIIESNEYIKTEILKLNQIIYEDNKLNFFKASQNRFEEFWFQNTKRYIYGAGKIAEKVTDFLCQKGWDQYEGYVVTKKENEEQLFYGKKVWQLDEVPEDEIGIVIAMNEQNTREVLPLLNNRKGTHCFILRGMEL